MKRQGHVNKKKYACSTWNNFYLSGSYGIFFAPGCQPHHAAALVFSTAKRLAIAHVIIPLAMPLGLSS